jgi:hypothetical protein
MIQIQTYLNVADNTGAQKLMCIQILGSNRQYAVIGDIIIVVVKMRFLYLECFFNYNLIFNKKIIYILFF